MEYDPKKHILGVTITAFITAITGGVFAYYTSSVNDRLLIERDHARDKAAEKGKALETAENSLKELLDKLKKMEEELATCKSKYDECLRPVGTTFVVGYLDSDWHEKDLRTGDRIEFKFNSSSLFARLKRVTENGPVFVVDNCPRAHVENSAEIEIEGELGFLVENKEQLEITASSRCCLEGLAHCPDPERIVLQGLSFRPESTTAKLRFGRFIGD